MKTINLTIELEIEDGDETSAELSLALEEVKSKVEQGFTSGQDTGLTWNTDVTRE